MGTTLALVDSRVRWERRARKEIATMQKMAERRQRTSWSSLRCCCHRIPGAVNGDCSDHGLAARYLRRPQVRLFSI
jgi:hypothetical protein